jgi:hypothetical protein
MICKCLQQTFSRQNETKNTTQKSNRKNAETEAK